MNRNELMSINRANGGLYLGTVDGTDGRSVDLYFFPENTAEGWPDEMQVLLVDEEGKDKATDLGRITTGTHPDLCALVLRHLKRLHDRAADAMEGPE